MAIRPRILFVSTLLVFSSAISSAAQHVPQRPLITQAVDEGRLVRLKGNTHPLARPQFDIGTAAPDLPLRRMLLVLKRSPEQDAALVKLLDDQQDKASPNYHKWLTPDEFGLQFGPADQDIQAVTGWLQSHGLQVNRVTHGKTIVEFSGVESQVEEALHTQVHKYLMSGEEHWANANDPQIPAALASAVAGVWSLHDFRKKPDVKLLGEQIRIPQPGASPMLTSSGRHALMPGDYSTIYNITPVYNSGVNGQSSTIAVVARSEFDQVDALDFHSLAGMPITLINHIDDGPSPGILSGGEEAEAVLDATWSSAIAPQAQVNFVVSASTNTSDGVDLSELYIIDNNAGDIMTESFGSCEGFASAAEAAALSALSEQAAAEGITYFVSSGDSGAEGCDNPNHKSANGDAPSVNVLASPPFTVAVGGTVFNEGSNSSKYWNSSNNPSTLASAKSYIPEDVWNESCTTCGLWSSGGGSSIFFSKPNWQSGVSGIPNDGARDLPDISLTAALHDAYLICFERSCEQGFLDGIGGTSASSPSFAGIMALIVQQYGRQGQANYVLYRLAAAETLSQCNASNTSTLPNSSCVFNDVTSGNNAVPGEAGFGTATAKYQAKTGYDLATGLGSVNVANLISKWNTAAFNPTTTTLSPTTINTTHGNPVTLNISVAPSSGSGVPSGDVSLLTSDNHTPGFFTLASGSASGTVDNLPGGSYTLTARYAGDSKFAPSTSSGVQVNIAAENSITTASILTVDQNGHAVPFTSGSFGGFTYPRADVAGQSGNGIATGFAYFFDNGTQFGARSDLNSEGYTVFPFGVSFFSPGQHSLTALYGGDSSFNSSTSAPVSFSISKAVTTTSLSASANSAAQGNSVTFTATVASAAFAGRTSATFPFGTMEFFDGNTQIGSAPLVATDAITQNGVTSFASLSASNLPTGQNTISVQYSGDQNYLASNSPSVTVSVEPDFAIAPANPTVTVASPGGTGTDMLTITGQPGYGATVNFSNASCTGLPQLSQCTFNPASLIGNGSTTVTVTTKAPTASVRQGALAGLGIVFAGVLLFGVPMRRFRPIALCLLLFGSLALTSMGCGGGSSGGGGGGGSPGTPPGSYNVIVTATTSDGAITHTTSFTLAVQ